MSQVIQHILVPLDGSEVGERALPHAALLARLFGARVTLARVGEPLVVPEPQAGPWIGLAFEAASTTVAVQAYLEEVAQRPEFADLPVDVVVPPFPVAAGLISVIESHGIDLVVMTTHGFSGFTRMLLGSVADKLVRYGPAACYLVRATQVQARPVALRRIVVPLDGSPLAEAAVKPALALAKAAGAQLDLVSVPSLPAYATVAPEAAAWIPDVMRALTEASQAYLAALAGRLTAESGVRVATSVEPSIAGSVADALMHHVHREDADLVVMSSHGRGGLGRWLLGSVTDHLLRISDRPVWVVRPEASAATP